MKAWLSKLSSIKKISTYIILGVVVFFIGLLFHFPMERVSQLITYQIERQTGYVINPEEVSFALPLGIQAKNVEIRGVFVNGQEIPLMLDEVTLRVSPISAITFPLKKTGSASFYARRKKETIRGQVSLGKETMDAELQIKDFMVDQVFALDGVDPMLTGSQIAIKSPISVEVQLVGNTTSISQGNLSVAQGSALISSNDVLVNAPFAGEIQLEQLKIDASLDNGNLEIKSASLYGPKIELKASGEIKLAPYVMNSRMKLEIRIKADPNDPQLGSLMPMIASMNGLAIDSTGSLNMTITGAFNDPQRISVKGF
ncbi:MAG: type II secretion system protein GspN [Bdellovibrionota bacterium]